MRRLTLAAAFAFAVLMFPAGALATSSNYAICHDGSLSDDAGQGCTNDGPYGGAPAAAAVTSNYAICHDGILSDDAGQNCADGLYARTYGLASTTPASSYQPTTVVSSGGGYSDVPGVPQSFAACVAMRESTNGAGSPNIYGIEGPGGQGSLAEQKQAFAQMYAARGTEPWAPYDGC